MDKEMSMVESETPLRKTGEKTTEHKRKSLSFPPASDSRMRFRAVIQKLSSE
jgi:hypothetical protein